MALAMRRTRSDDANGSYPIKWNHDTIGAVPGNWRNSSERYGAVMRIIKFLVVLVLVVAMLGVGLPMMRNCFGSLSVTASNFGAGSVAALAASSP